MLKVDLERVKDEKVNSSGGRCTHYVRRLTFLAIPHSPITDGRALHGVQLLPPLLTVFKVEDRRATWSSFLFVCI